MMFTVGAGHARDVLRFCFIAFLFCTITAQADYQAGLDAYNATNYRLAMQQWQAVIEAPPTATNPLIYAETHYAIAMLYWQGQGVSRDFYKAYEWLQQAAELNHAGAMAKLGYLYTDGIAVPQDLDQAFEWYNKAAKLGDVDGLYNLGIFYLNGWGTEQNTTLGKQYLAAAAAQGDEAAEAALTPRDSESAQPSMAEEGGSDG
jgi:TPR repeat protein